MSRLPLRRRMLATLAAAAATAALLIAGTMAPAQAATAYVFGTVTGPDGKPLSSGKVKVYQLDGQLASGRVLAFPYTSSVQAKITDGHFAFTCAPSFDTSQCIENGTYYFQFIPENARDILAEFYGDSYSITGATPVTVSGAANLSVQLNPAAHLTGTVYTAPGQPATSGAVDAQVRTANGWRKTSPGSVISPSDGSFDIGGLEPGEYRTVASSSGDWATTYYSTPSNPEGVVSLTTGQRLSGIDITVARGATITGTAHDANGPLTGKAYLYLHSGNGNDYLNRDAPIVNGSFSFAALNPGTYKVGYSSTRGAIEYYHEASTMASAQLVTVGQDADTVVLQDEYYDVIGDFTKPFVYISGTPTVGSTLTASARATPAPDSFEFQWKRDGAAIPGATSGTYTPTPADAAHSVSVEVVAHRAGYNPVQYSSAAVNVAAYASRAPVISGSTSPGGTLTLDIGDWQLGDHGYTTTIEWYRNGKLVSNGGSTTLKTSWWDWNCTFKAVVKASSSEQGWAGSSAESNTVTIR